MNYDLIIKNGFLVDGTGKGGYRADVAVKDGKIARVGDLSGATAGKIIDAGGAVVAPGFIDIHTHADEAVRAVPKADNYIRQGVTTVIGTNCGGGAGGVEVAEFLAAVAAAGPSVNYGTLVGHGDIRLAGMADSTTAANDDEMAKMESLVEKAMLEGAFGMSSGLEYWPGRYATTEELVRLARVAGRHGGFYATHSRNEQTGVITAVGEAIEIGRRAGVPVEISHLKPCGAAVWGYGATLVSMVSMARAMGVDVTADQYPYGASCTGFSQCFPDWALEGGNTELAERLKDAVLLERIKAYAANQIRIRVGEDLSLIQISTYQSEPSYAGKTMRDILVQRRLAPSMENGIDLVIEMYLAGEPMVIYHYIDEEDIKTIMRSPYVSVVTDGHICKYGEASPHPRSYGTFARVLGRYVREEQVITLEEAVRKMTSLPAGRLGLADRGVLKEGNRADITVFSEEEIADTATFFEPHQYAAGIEYVIVNGEITVEKGFHTGAACGQILYGAAKR
ncbi:MAG: N-acyl-D-amino-acid deacylase family protein [bacterium]